MDIYVEGKLPKCCLVCKLECPEEQRCVDGFTMDCDYCGVSERPATCPLKPLSDRLAEERKKVVQEIRDLAGDYFEMPYCDACGNTDFNDVVLTGNDLTEILDDVERGK